MLKLIEVIVKKEFFMQNNLPAINIQFKLLLSNPIFLSCLFSWIGAQFLKTAINLIYGKIHSLKDLLAYMFWRTGGMPSSHSALVTSLCTTIGFRHGFNSDIFVFALAFFLVVLRDAFGVRRSSGMQCKKINWLGKELKEKKVLDEYSSLKEVNGHTPMEVLCGCLVGFFIGLAFSLLK